MLVLNLACGLDHPFEGWFGSADDFDSQLQRGLLTCPVCGSSQIERRPNAPRLNVAHPRGEASTPVPTESAATDAGLLAMQQQLQQIVRQVIARTEDVGDRFAEEARRIHYGEIEQRGIRGRTSVAEAEALADEGIAVLPLPLPPEGSLQ
jgi:hypothetical protein